MNFEPEPELQQRTKNTEHRTISPLLITFAVAEMSIYRKVRAVEKVFKELEKEVATFKKATSLECATGCGLCCYKQDIEASILEFLPLAYQVYKRGEAHKVIESISSNPGKSLCHNLNEITHIFSPNGSCREYPYRGLICRLFGFSAMVDKYGSPKLVTCQTIKSGNPEAYPVAIKRMSAGMKVPLIKDYYYRMRFIDPSLGTELMPINLAILNAIKVVLGHYSYRTPRNSRNPRKAG